ncbi:hypothetical protein MHZ92_07635 [Sporosarcina sp. ACRSL]|uniref:hypothetical protein n=1 Tax=Sporosarcina sp. ACRSL TaxID=2918215 RepID=UPI001EF5A42E|nr:hypothetical protein [Sporosarcina sp. ACRSL]MCG7343999.1 hypothetical protein [Sporosarcina sp. ACRSL]
MKKLQMLFYFGLLTLILYGCSSNIKSVGSKEIESMDISSYFPPIGMMRTYVQYGTNGQTMEANDSVNLSINSDGPDTVYIHEKGGLAIESIKEFIVTDEEIRLVYVINALKNEETSVVELANKPKWEKKDMDKSVSHITATGLTVVVPAGSYDNVIEVTTVIPDDKKGRRTVHYYAPNIGLIRTVFGFEDGDEFTFSELKSAKTGNKEEVNNVIGEEEKGSKSENGNSTGSKQKKKDDKASSVESVQEIYSNKQYGFSFKMPADILKRLTVDTGSWDSDAVATVDFTFTESSRSVEQLVFSIIVFANEGNDDTLEHPFYKYIGSNDSYIFAYAMSSEPNEVMLRKENEDLLHEVRLMVESSEQAMETFEVN